MKKISRALALGLALFACGTAAARPDVDPPKAWQDVRALVVRFNDAQNAHNLDVSSALLLDSPNLEWIEGNAMLRGHDAAVARLAQFYRGIWAVLPDYGQLNISLVGPDEAQVSVPIEYGSGQVGQTPNTTYSMLTALAVRTADGWRLALVQHEPAPLAAF